MKRSSSSTLLALVALLPLLSSLSVQHSLVAAHARYPRHLDHHRNNPSFHRLNRRQGPAAPPPGDPAAASPVSGGPPAADASAGTGAGGSGMDGGAMSGMGGGMGGMSMAVPATDAAPAMPSSGSGGSGDGGGGMGAGDAATLAQSGSGSGGGSGGMGGGGMGSKAYQQCVQQCMVSVGVDVNVNSGSGGGGKGKGGKGGGGTPPLPAPPPPAGSASSPPPPPASPPPPPPGNASTNAVGDLLAGPGQVVVAPKMGDLRMVPFNIAAKPGDKVQFVWGAGPHTVTESSALAICNASKASGAFKSGMQNKGFTFDVQVKDTKPIWYYCTVKDHCLKGMFGVINAPTTADPNKQMGGKMAAWGQQSADNQALIDATITILASSSASPQISDWGSDLDASHFQDWAMPYAMQGMLKTRQYFAQNPQLLAATNSSSSANSTSTSPITGGNSTLPAGNGTSATAGVPTAGTSAAPDVNAAGAAGNASASMSGMGLTGAGGTLRRAEASLLAVLFAVAIAVVGGVVVQLV